MPHPLWERLLRNRRTGARRYRVRIGAIDELPPEERNRPETIALRAQLVEGRAALKRRYDERLAELDHIIAGDLARLEDSDDDVVLIYRTSAKLLPPDPPVPGSSQDGAVVTARPVPSLLGVTAPLPPPLGSRLLPSSWLSLTGGNIRPAGNTETVLTQGPALEPFAATTPLRPPRNLEGVATSQSSPSGNTSGTAQNTEAVPNPLLPPEDLESLPTPWLTFSVNTIEPTQNTEAVLGQVISCKRPRPESPESINPLDTVDDTVDKIVTTTTSVSKSTQKTGAVPDQEISHKRPRHESPGPTNPVDTVGEDIPIATSVAEPLESNPPDSDENVATATSATEPLQSTNSSTPLRRSTREKGWIIY